MAGPLGGAGCSPAAATTEDEDVDGGPPGVLAVVRQQPPPKMKTSMVGPLGGAGGSLAAATTEDEAGVDGRPPRGDVASSAVATTEDEDVDGGPLTSMAICSEFCKKNYWQQQVAPKGAGPELPLFAMIHLPHL
jgi:hypothetical protein